MDNSYMSMRSSEIARIELSIKKAIIYDGLCSYSEGGIDDINASTPDSFYLKLHGVITKSEHLIGEHRDEQISLPKNRFELLFQQKEYSEIVKKESKFPRGYCQIQKIDSHFTFFVWPELYTTILNSSRNLNNSELSVIVEIPFFESFPDTYIPILGYSFVTIIEK